jgi:low affinity Fe/Cu permease
MTRRPALLETVARKVAHWTGSSWAFGLAVMLVVVWLASWPFFTEFDTWQLVINTGTTIITFLMVFLIQRSQNIDAHAIQLKLNELLAAMHGASNRLINVEDLSEEELAVLHRHFQELAALAKKDGKVTSSHSVEEASRRHGRKGRRKGKSKSA